MLKLFLLTSVILSISFSCSNQKIDEDNSEKNGTSMTKSPQDPDKFVITGHILEKEFIIKNGVSSGIMELYFRASIQDYFIKFCESKITKEDLEPFVNKVISAHVEIKNGNWDICPDDPQEMQSRVGPYIIIKEIKS